MKTKYLFLSAIFVILGLSARSQVYEMYYQGFESNESVNYFVSSSTDATIVSNLVMGGQNAMKLIQSTAEDVVFITQAIDFTQNTTLRYIALEFDHICNVPVNGNNDYDVGMIYVKRANQGDEAYQQLTGNQHYNRDEEFSDDFRSMSSFSQNSYTPDWTSSTMTNEYWHHERFDIDNILTSSVPTNERLLVFKFVLKRKTSSGAATGAGWWLDNIRIRSSASQIKPPTIEMLVYPDGGPHPSSRGARIELYASTTVTAGINQDSVYIIYKVGSDTTKYRMPMTAYTATSSVYGSRTVFRGRIPFEGYDTLMQFYCVARDASPNANERTFPKSAGTWIKYWCVRGTSRDYQPVPESFDVANNNSNSYPFPAFADNRAEYVYDSALLANAGYGPGAITDLRFTLAGTVGSTQVRPRFQLRMKNAATTRTVSEAASRPPFTEDYMHVVYDSALVITQGAEGAVRLIHLKDTFFYAGKDIIVQTIYDGGNSDPAAVKVKTIPTATNKKTIWFYGKDGEYGTNTYTDDDMKWGTNFDGKRPAFLISQSANLPLIYDLGVSALIDPNYNTPISSVPAQITVQLKNYGVSTINGVRISYRIVTPTTSDTLTGYYDWTGSLAASATTSVVIATGITLPAGYHTLSAWTEDSLTVGGELYRDHEPYNNEKSSPFIVCDGPLHGVRTIGGANADYSDIEEFLFSLSRCGINDSLVVRLAPGCYPPFVMPPVTGLSQQHYIVFCPLTDSVVLYSDNTSGAASIVDLDSVSNIRFRDITFSRRSGALTNMVTLGMNSHNCRFDRCVFVDSLANAPASLRINALIHSGYANNVRIDNCTFLGGNIGANLVGQASTIRSSGHRVTNSLFRQQNASAVVAQNLSNVTVKRNEMYDVMGNASYVLLVYSCYDTVNILANKVYTTHGAGAIGVSDVYGTSALHAIVANNMVVCNDDGTGNQLTTPFNIIQGSWIDAVYNSVKMTAPTRYSIPAATFGGGLLSNSRFLNNIVTCYDQVNYAFNYILSQSENCTIGHNVYYSEGVILNRRSPGGAYSTLAAWTNAVPSDNASQSFNPTFINGSTVDLRTFNRQVKGIGIPLTNVTTDMFDTVRSTTATCPGAFEFVSLQYDFETEALINPTDNCDMPQSVELVVRLRNNGANNYVYGGSVTLSIGYSINGSAPSTVAVQTTIPSEDTVSVHTGRMLSLPTNGTFDSTYVLTLWVESNNDPNQTNDTNVFTVVSRYHEPAADTMTALVPYATAATLAPTNGVMEWNLYNSTSPAAPKKRDNIYWYYAEDDDDYFYVGDTLVTEVLRRDTVFYIRQRRDAPVVRITQVMIKGNNAVGVSNLPSWISTSTKLAVQLSNVGDDTAYLQGHTLLALLQNTSKTYNFGDLRLAPGSAIVVQFASGTSNANTVFTGSSTSATITNPNGVIFKQGTTVIDAVAINGITTNSSWSTPGYVWSGNGVSITSASVGGIIRTAFNGQASDWRQATAAAPMFLDSVAPAWIRFVANGCLGDISPVYVTMQAPPTADIELTPVPLSSGCGLGMEDVSVHLHNYGTQAINGLTLNYTAGGSTYSETLSAPLASGGDSTYTFIAKLNMNTPVDSTFNVVIWATAVSGDSQHSNDTCSTSAVALYTPAMPVRPAVEDVPYATADTLTIYPGARLVPVWYNANMVATDTGYVHITDLLYADENIGVAYMVADSAFGQIGTATTTTSKNEYPSPYQSYRKNAKQQYIYSASELLSAGLQPGKIWKLAFHLDSIWGTVSSVSFGNYNIAVAFTEDTIFTSNTAWKDATVVYSRNPFVLQRSSTHQWVEHELDTPIDWDGVSSIVVQVSQELSSAYTTGVMTAFSNKTNTAIYKADNNALATGTAAIDFVGSGTRSPKRPNIMFYNIKFGCASDVAVTTLHLIGVPNTDAKIYWPEGTDTVVYNNCANVSMNVNVRNLGITTLNNYTLKYSIDNQPMDSTVLTTTLVPGAITQPQLFSRPLMPGRHHVMAIVLADGDSVNTNDTIYRDFTVRFCGGTYTISATNPAADYTSISQVADSLYIAGIVGPVVFTIDAGTYNDQISLHEVYGSSSTNTITFRGVADSSVVITYSTTNTANYVFQIDGASNVIFDSLTIYAVPSLFTGNNANYANALDISNADNITLDHCTVRVHGAVDNANASCIVLKGNVSNLLVKNCLIDSGYYSVKSTGTVFDYNNLTFQNNYLTGFWARGIDLKGVTGVDITANHILSGLTKTNRGLVGIYLEQVDSSTSIQKNHVYLVDNVNGGKVGIYLKNVQGSAILWGYIVNNMLSCSGTGNGGNAPHTYPSGIYVDDNCAYLNIYYNTMRVYAGPTQNNSRALNIVGNNTNHIQVMNNIFANASKSHAYYVQKANNVSNSDYNAYFTEGVNLAYWVSNCATLADLQTANSRDANSLNEEPYFTSENDLHLIMANFATKAQYNTDVIEDIDGNIRPQIPAPTIGAHEMARQSHNMSIVRVVEPTLPATSNKPNNIETDSVKVKVEFYNNGLATETNVRWYAYIEDHQTATASVIRNVGSFFSGQMKTDSVYMPTPLGLIDTHTVRVIMIVDFDDEDTTDNTATAPVWLAPAFDIKADSIRPVRTGCDLRQTGVRITLKNAGFKDIPAGALLSIGFHAEAYKNASFSAANRLYNIPTIPDMVVENHVLATSLDSAQITTINFDSLVNFYPTDTFADIKIRLYGWVRYIYDVNFTNDSTVKNTNNPNQNSPSPYFNSFYSPAAPVGRDTTFAYGTWGKVKASQINSRPIRWFRDSTASSFFTGNEWNTTPQYFHDSTYYLLCLSANNCSSYFSEVHVSVFNQQPYDAGLEAVVAPKGGRVYMSDDTVRVRVANYGTQTITSLPITYQVRRRANNNTQTNNPMMTVTEICTVPIAPNETYVYKFDSLIHFTDSIHHDNYQKRYYVRAWTDLDNDATRRSDTLRWKEKLRVGTVADTALDYPFNALDTATYPEGDPYASSNKIDIVRVSFNEIDFDIPPLGRSYTNMGSYRNPEWPVLHVKRGMIDSVLLKITNPSDQTTSDRGKVAVYIDFNRNGSFNDPGECVVLPQVVYTNTLQAYQVAIPNSASYGHMKMRVVASVFEEDPTPTLAGDKGHMIDFMLFVDAQPPSVDLAITQIVSPRDYLIRDESPVTISFRMSNKGTSTISSAEINYRFISDDLTSTSTGSFTWSGSLASGRSTVVQLPAFNFPIGTTKVRIWHTYNNDANRHNDTLIYEYHRFHVVTLTLEDNFDSLNYWYAPKGYTEYTRNYWECGTPSKTKISMAYTEPNAWVTGLNNNNITTGRRGNVSYLYSPIINIAQIRCDTISFRLQRNLINGSNLTLEFFNYESKWVKLDEDTLVAWYNNEEDHVFDDNSQGNAYNNYWISYKVTGDYNERLQFRFVYRTPQKDSPNAQFGEGCAVDNFRIGRAQRAIDVGVVEITKPEAPKFGQTIYPEVVVKNFGYDTATSLQLGYIYYGTYLARVADYECHIPPLETDTFQMVDPFIVTSDFPDTFAITAFSINTFDLYRDNDTNTKYFVLSPLDNDIDAYDFLSPLNRVIAGDSVTVTMRIRNFGLSSIPSATLSYVFNDYLRVDEEVDIVSLLGRPLASREYFNYTFKQKFRAPMGIMNLTGIAKCDSNSYIYNDTITKRVEGISSITDIAAASVVVDTSSYNKVKVQLVIDNRGSRGANNFEVGFWYDNDTSTRFSETYVHEEPLPALTTGYHIFSIDLDTRPAPWNHFVGYVHIDDDNDPSNDTTTLITKQFVDVEVMGLIVEENAQPDCRVFIQMRNIGNLTLTGKTLSIRATVNGNDLSDNIVRTLEPGHIVTIEFSRRIPKDPMRHYAGTCRLQNLMADVNQSNNQSTQLSVVNYFEGVPTVNAGKLVLDQNYPNPFSGLTTVPFSLPDAANVRFFVMDAMGKIVNSFERFFAAGDNTVVLDMQAYTSGVYYYGIEVDGQRQMRKMILR